MNTLRSFRCYNLCVNYTKNLNKINHKLVIRSLLSPTYSCEPQWDSRLKSDLLTKISPGISSIIITMILILTIVT